ncbi:MAG: hypothetical protein ACI4KA_04755 [Oscillospiraceae bacterium]
MMHTKRINLYRSARKTPGASGRIKAAAAAGAIIAAAAIMCGIKYRETARLKSEQTLLSRQLAQVTVTEYDSLCAENELLTERNARLKEDVHSSDELYLGYPADLFERIDKLCTNGVEIVSIMADGTEITLRFTAMSADAAACFAQSFIEEEIFDNTTYSGFSKVGGRYEFALVCCISDKEARNE